MKKCNYCDNRAIYYAEETNTPKMVKKRLLISICETCTPDGWSYNYYYMHMFPFTSTLL